MNGRALEVLLMPGFVLAAIPFAGSIPTSMLVSKGALLALASLLLVAGVYATNSYFGYPADQLNARLRSGQLGSRAHYIWILSLAFPASLLVFHRLNPALPPLALAIFFLWIAYSVPSGAKSRPVLGTALHFVGQVLQFHLGILTFSNASVTTLLISFFFAALFSSGHLMHELKDFESDRKAGSRTNAVVFGPGRVIAFYRRILFFLPVYWATLYALGKLTLPLFLPLFLAAFFHVGLAVRLTGNAIARNQAFQSAYRAIYLVAGLVTFGASRL